MFSQLPPSDPARFTEAVDAFRKRVPVSDAAWRSMTDAARSKAFKVAGVAQLSVVSDVAKALDKAIADGETLADFKKRVSKKLKAEWAGTVANPAARIETIFRTNVQTAYAEGTWHQLQSPDTKRVRPYIKSTPILDLRTEEICRAIGVVILPSDHPWWHTHWAPLHFNALAAGTPITTARGKVPIEEVQPGELVLTHRRRWRRVYATMGKPAETPRVRAVHLSSGRVLRVTDEHPVLTADGWKSAGDLQVGDKLFQHRQPHEGLGDATVANPEDFPSPPDEPSIAFQVVRDAVRPFMDFPVNFKCNPVDGESEVEDVWALNVLKDVGDAALGQDAAHKSLHDSGVSAHVLGKTRACPLSYSCNRHGVGVAHSPGMHGGPFIRFLPAPPGPMVGPAGMRGLRVGDGDLLGLRADGDSMPDAPPADLAVTQSKVSLNGAEGLSALNVTSADDGLKGGLVAEIEWVHATVISIVAADSTPDVWNLAVEEDETYLAEDLIVHNCRRSQVGLTEKQALKQGVTKAPPAVSAAPGFGNAPGFGTGWEPDPADYPEALVDAKPQVFAPTPESAPVELPALPAPAVTPPPEDLPEPPAPGDDPTPEGLPTFAPPADGEVIERKGWTRRKVYEVPLEELDDVPAVVWVQGRAEEARRMYAEGKTPPPILVLEYQGLRELQDGNHRLAVARELGLKTIPVRFLDRKAAQIRKRQKGVSPIAHLAPAPKK